MLEFWWQISKQVPVLFWESIKTVEGVVAAVIFGLLLVNRKLAEKVSGWHGVNPRWALVPLVLLFMWNVATAIYKPYKKMIADDATLVAENQRLKESTSITAKNNPSPKVLTPRENKYVCATELPKPLFGKGQYGYLLEFGVIQEDISAFTICASFFNEVISVSDWPGTPGRIDSQLPWVMPMHFYSVDNSPCTGFTSQSNSLVITPKQSFYLYFEADKPIKRRKVLFISQFHLRIDTASAIKEGGLFIEDCPSH